MAGLTAQMKGLRVSQIDPVSRFYFRLTVLLSK